MHREGVREGGKKGPNLGFMSAHLSRNDGELMSVVVEKGHLSGPMAHQL